MKKIGHTMFLIIFYIFTMNFASADLNDGLVAHYPFDSNANDIAGGNHGTPHGGVNYTTGREGQAATFDGIDDFILVTDDESLRISKCTIVAWVKTNMSLPVNHKPTFIVARSGIDGLSGYELEITAIDEKAGFVALSDSSNFKQILSSNKITDGKWHHLAGVYSGNICMLYVDGVLESSANYTAGISYSPGDPLIFGKRQQIFNTTFFSGLIDEARIYNRALSESEIGQLFDAFSTCQGDFSPFDGDVDGADLAAYIFDSASISLDVFAEEFGNNNCK